MSAHSRHTDPNCGEALSALVDGQATPDELDRILNAWKTHSGVRQAWHEHQFVGDVMRSAELAQGSDGDQFLAKLRSRMAQEPVVLAPAAARAVAPVSSGAAAPLQRRSWAAPAAVAAGFVMVVGAMVSALAPHSSAPLDELASGEHRIHLASQELDPALGVTAVVPVASALVSSDRFLPGVMAWQPATVAQNSFSQPARVSGVLISEPRMDPLLHITSVPWRQDASFAAQQGLTQQVSLQAP